MAMQNGVSVNIPNGAGYIKTYSYLVFYTFAGVPKFRFMNFLLKILVYTYDTKNNML